jgi:DNA-binding NarL/FixJ family response regulator
VTTRSFVLSADPKVLRVVTRRLTEIPVVDTPDGPGRLRAYGIPGAAAPIFRPDDFTPREWQLLMLIDQGLTSGQIGTKLGVNADTVKSHSYSLYKKLGVHTRPEAVLVAYRHGWLS